MSDTHARASKGPARYERAFDWAMSLFASFSPLVLLGVVLTLLLDGFVRLLHLFGIGNAMPGLPDNEIEVVFLAAVFISLLLVILRGLGRISDRVEAVERLLRRFADKGVEAASRDDIDH